MRSRRSFVLLVESFQKSIISPMLRLRPPHFPLYPYWLGDPDRARSQGRPGFDILPGRAGTGTISKTWIALVCGRWVDAAWCVVSGPAGALAAGMRPDFRRSLLGRIKNRGFPGGLSSRRRTFTHLSLVERKGTHLCKDMNHFEAACGMPAAGKSAVWVCTNMSRRCAAPLLACSLLRWVDMPLGPA